MPGKQESLHNEAHGGREEVQAGGEELHLGEVEDVSDGVHAEEGEHGDVVAVHQVDKLTIAEPGHSLTNDSNTGDTRK